MKDEEIKRKVKPLFLSNFKKFYPSRTLEEYGFKRRICKKCGRPFWSIEERDVCGECEKEYSFIGKKNAIKLKYKDYWEIFKKRFKKWGYVPLNRYPVVAKWLPNIDFVFAGINIFQPYAVNGEVEPPASMTIEPQFCLRFNDVDNVGITGRHYTGFIMIGQHVFNTRNKKYVWKDKGISQIIDFFTKDMKIKLGDIVLNEDVWAGGGNFGPSIEFFSKGLELANQVFMQYEQTDDGYRELSTKVIDMGAGHERWAWYAHGSNTSYDVVFPKVLKYLYSFGKPKIEYMRYLSSVDLEEKKTPWEEISRKVGIPVVELKREIDYASAVYSIADHTRSLLVAINDGAIPSNVGGGYNLRNLLRRIFAFIDKYKLDLDLMKVFELQVKEFGSWYGISLPQHLQDIIKIEKKKYYKTIERGKRLINKIGSFDDKTMIKLYESEGITPEMIKEIKPEAKVPTDFYSKLQKLHRRSLKKEKKFDTKGIPKTKLEFYKNDKKFDFSAKVLKIMGKWVVLNKTYFYPRGGGQDCDTGKINGVKVVEVIKQDGVVFHKLKHKPKFKINEIVNCKVDKERRRILTIHHSAVHVLGYAIKKVLGKHAMQCGSEKTIEKARLDVTHYEIPSFEQVKEIEKIANEIVQKGVRVEKFFLERNIAEEKYGIYIYAGGAVPGKILRIVKIDDLDVQACGGTHVDNTKEIGLIKIINVEKVKDGVVRFEIVADGQALKRMEEEEKILHELSSMWNVKYEDIVKTANKFFSEWKEQRKMLKKLIEEYSYLKIQKELSTGKKLIVVKLPITLSHAISLLKSIKFDNAIIIIGTDGGVGISKNDVDVKKELKKYFKNVVGNSREARGF